MSWWKQNGLRLLEQKGHDYTNLKGQECFTYLIERFDDAIEMLVTMKLHRMESVLFKSSKVKESFQDSLTDLCNYVALFLRDEGKSLQTALDMAYDPFYLFGFLNAKSININPAVKIKILSVLNENSPTASMILNKSVLAVSVSPDAPMEDFQFLISKDIKGHVDSRNWYDSSPHVYLYSFDYTKAALVPKSSLCLTEGIIGSLFRYGDYLLYLKDWDKDVGAVFCDLKDWAEESQYYLYAYFGLEYWFGAPSDFHSSVQAASIPTMSATCQQVYEDMTMILSRVEVDAVPFLR